MREIKFRVWNKLKKCFFVSNHKIGIDNTNVSLWGEVQQCTGLKDKNGKEIYEGDIVQFHKGYVDDSWTDTEQGKPYLIIFSTDDKGEHDINWGYWANRGNKYLIPRTRTEFHPSGFEWEIIGNIHENKELL